MVARDLAYEAVTRNLVVRVRPSYLEHQSNPAERLWVWAYAIEIENMGEETVQLVSRHWIITDAWGRVEHVRGPGVVGDQPWLKPGQRYAYASGCPLPTSSGSMVGTYQMVTEEGDVFEIAIPAFSLDTPSSGRTVN